MNTRRLALALGLVVGLLQSAVYADDGTTLKYKLAKGDKLVYRTKMEMKQSQTIMGMAVENEMTHDAISSYTVDAVDEQGNARLTVKGEQLKSTAKFPALGEFTFDSKSSERDKSSAIGAAMTPLMERMSGIMYQATVPPDGGVIAVNGYADQLRDLVEGNPLTGQFAGGGTDESAKQSLEGIFPKVGKPMAKPGDTWDVPVEIPMGKVGKLSGKSTFRFVGLDQVGDRATAKLEVTEDLSLDLDIDMNGAKVTGKIGTDNSSGIVQFDISAGRVLSGQATISMSGMLNVNVNGMDIPIQNNQTMKSTVEYLEKLPN
jgi:hypothetical protein